jgi:hypothetical protein
LGVSNDFPKRGFFGNGVVVARSTVTGEVPVIQNVVGHKLQACRGLGCNGGHRHQHSNEEACWGSHSLQSYGAMEQGLEDYLMVKSHNGQVVGAEESYL